MRMYLQMDEHQQAILDTFYDSPAYFVRGLEEDRKMLVLQRMSRQTYQSSSFLNEKLEAADDLYHLLPLDQTLAHFRQSAPLPKPIHYIFHFAFCGSTLLSRCMDYPDHTMVYKEPDLLHQIGYYLRFPNVYSLPAKELLSFGLSSVQRTFQSTETPIVKLTDSCSNLPALCLDVHAEARAIVVYNSLETFLLATLKSRKRRQYTRGMYIRARNDMASAGISLEVSKHMLSDAQMSGYVWLSLMYRYTDWLSRYGSRFRSLKMDSLLAAPLQTMQAASSFMNLKIPPSLFEKTLDQGVFTRHAKAQHLQFDGTIYQSQKAMLMASLATEIEEGQKWVQQVKTQFPVDETLPAPLLPASTL